MDQRSEPIFLSEWDLGRLTAGAHPASYESLGAHRAAFAGRVGTRFAVWAPHADAVSVVGDFNGWDDHRHPLRRRGASGVWEGFAAEAAAGALYKYRVHSARCGYRGDKADPYAFAAEPSPGTASRICRLEDYCWGDQAWMAGRAAKHRHDAPLAIYEVHLGSWRRVPNEGLRWLTYAELADRLARYALDLGFTHIELLPVAEHPFTGSWGYQTTGYFAPTSRFGAPHDFMAFVDTLHRNGVGVILDWTPAHFPGDAHGLARFDGTPLYEHPDPRMAHHAHWDTLVFDYGRPEVANFLVSNAIFWCDRYHVDGLRVDAVASMLYRDYGRGDGEWSANQHGGKENLEAVAFLRRLNEEVYARFPDVLTVAEESTAWPGVSRPTTQGGLGFGFKWNMGWMHDTLAYFGTDPIHRRHQHDRITFGMLYAHAENFVLPLSHDEVVHLKRSLLEKMAGDDEQKFANLRLLYTYLYTYPGKKLLFMGDEFAQRDEWNHDRSLDWHLLERAPHRGVQRLVADLNRLYRARSSLHACDHHRHGFEWVDCQDRATSVVSYLRRGPGPTELLLVVANFTPLVRHEFRVGVPMSGTWREVLNSDSWHYGGENMGNQGGVEAEEVPSHGRPFSLRVTVAGLAALILEPGDRSR